MESWTCKNQLPTLMCILGSISEDMKVEFAELLMEVAKKQKENAPETDDYLLEAFRTFDIERSGKISISTLKEAMINHGERLREEEINEMVAVASDARTDDENIIDYESKHNNTCYKKLKTKRLIISCVRSAFLDLPISGTLKAKHLKSEDV